MIVRVDAETKQQLETAAGKQGLTLTTFLLTAACAAAGTVEQRQTRQRRTGMVLPVPRQRPAPCPDFVNTALAEASRGGDQGYNRVGSYLLNYVPNLVAWKTRDQLRGKFEYLTAAIQDRDDDCVLAWFERELPRFMARIPTRRRQQFLEGVYQVFDKARSTNESWKLVLAEDKSDSLRVHP